MVSRGAKGSSNLELVSRSLYLTSTAFKRLLMCPNANPAPLALSYSGCGLVNIS